LAWSGKSCNSVNPLSLVAKAQTIIVRGARQRRIGASVQTTLLGVAIAIIVAVVTALVGPYFIDWNSFRPQLEAEATRLVGLPVHVGGAIDARLLPSPSVTLSGVAVGRPGEELQARSLGLELSLGALVRGQWRAVEMRLVGPQFDLALDKSGRIGLPSMSAGFDVDALSIERLNIEDGHAVLTDAASGARLVLDKFWFDGEVRSLLGSFRGEGAFVADGALYGYRVAASRADANGLKIRLGIDPSDRPLSAEAEGVLLLERGAPLFEGALSLTRAADAAPSGGATAPAQPWRAAARVKATAASTHFEQIEVQYGPDERAARLGGTADLQFGERPRLDGSLSSRQIDLDRLLSGANAQSTPAAATLRRFAENLAAPWRPPFPVAVGIAVDTVLLGGAPLQSVRGDIAADTDGWSVKALEFRAPGLTQVKLSGRLGVISAGGRFSGPVELSTGDAKTLAAWLAGRNDHPSGPPRVLRARGDLTLGKDGIAIERLDAEIDRKGVTGRLAYAWASGDRPARLDVELDAAELDIDAALGYARTAFSAARLDWPGEVAFAIDIGHATIAGVEARQARAKFRFDPAGLAIEKLSVADFGGGTLQASGRIDTSGASPRGTMTFDLEARDLSGAAAVASLFLPQVAERAREIAERAGAVKLHAALNLGAADGDGARSEAKLDIAGSVGAARINLNADASGEALRVQGALVRVAGNLESDDGTILTHLAGLDRVIAAGRNAGRLEFSADGPADGALHVRGRLAAGDFEAAAEGSIRLGSAQGASADLHLSVTNADLRLLRPAAAGTLPLSFTAKLALAGGKVALDEISGKIADSALHGRLAIDAMPPRHVEGKIGFAEADVASIMAIASGMPAPRAGEASLWTSMPFRPALFSDLDGRIEFEAARAALPPALVASGLRGVLRLTKSEMAFENVEGELAGGRFGSQFVLRREGENLATHARIELEGADAAILIRGAWRPPVSGRIRVRLEVDGSGSTPNDLIGSLAGSGSVSLDGARIAGLDPGAFTAASDAVDQGLAIDPRKIRDVVATALDAGSLAVPHIEAAITVAAGQARLTTIAARGDGADIAITGSYDLAQDALDARATLSGSMIASVAAGRPDIVIALKGPLAEPDVSLDVSALAGWLALRSADQQAKRLRELEGQRDKPGNAAPPKAAPSLPPPVNIAPLPGPKVSPRTDNVTPRSEPARAAAQ
jgi:large subunit ribosomal protein L24